MLPLLPLFIGKSDSPRLVHFLTVQVTRSGTVHLRLPFQQNVMAPPHAFPSRAKVPLTVSTMVIAKSREACTYYEPSTFQGV
jgi:hypothetical protein